jgi:dihydrofolate reductase
MIKFSAIAAVGQNMELGAGNDLLWHLPDDFKFFKATTMGAPIIMGRKTFESIGKPLPGRKNIVLTRDTNWSAEGVECFSSIEEMARTLDTSQEHFVIGGAQIYKQFMPIVSSLYLTHVDAEFDTADAFFPKVENAVWASELISEHIQDEKHKFPFRIVKYTRF